MEQENKIISLRLDGSGMTPESLGKELLSYLSSVYDLADSVAEGEIGITRVENNCLLVKVAASIALNAALLCNPGSVSAKYYNAAQKLNRFIRDKNCVLTILNENDFEVCSVDGKERRFPEAPVEDSIYYRGMTTIYGELLTVGGAGEANIHIGRNVHGKRVTVILKVTREQARQLGSQVYRNVGVIADVEFKDYEILDGEVVEIMEAAPNGDWEEWLDDILPFTSGVYGDIDVVKYVNEIRGREDEEG